MKALCKFTGAFWSVQGFTVEDHAHIVVEIGGRKLAMTEGEARVLARALNDCAAEAEHQLKNAVKRPL